MGFLEDLRAYLERPELFRPGFTPDLAAHRRHLLDALQRLEQRHVAERELVNRHSSYSMILDQLVTIVGNELAKGLAYGATSDELRSLVNIAIERGVGLGTSTGSRTKDRELDRIREIAWTTAWMGYERRSFIPNYASTIRAIRHAGPSLELTPIGRLIMELPDHDALRLMLAIEAARVYPGNHPLCLSRKDASNFINAPSGVRRNRTSTRNPHQDPGVTPVPDSLLMRLNDMGIARVVEGDNGLYTQWELLPEGRLLLEEIASDEPTPFTVLAKALLQDETAAVLGQYRPVAAMVQREGAAAATTRHARMVAHEIRNALVPVQAAVGALYRDIDRSAEPTRLVSHRDAIEGGIGRVFQFIKEMVEIAARGAEPASPFDLIPVIEEAIAAVAPELGLRASFSPPEALPPVIGHRNRLTMTMVNLLRNAAQAHGGPDATVRIAASVSAGGEEITVTVDDNGPGVPPAMREAIFRPGVSLRPGGSGEGLALVREVVEGELGGRATCEDGPDGGARFVLRIPVRARGAGG